MESILTSIKKLLGIEDGYEHFDQDIVIHINMALTVLTQLGVGPSEGFTITDESSLWTDFVSDIAKIEAVKTYVYLKVRLVFDPPSSSSVLESMKQSINELEWRLNVIAETTEIEN